MISLVFYSILYKLLIATLIRCSSSAPTAPHDVARSVSSTSSIDVRNINKTSSLVPQSCGAKKRLVHDSDLVDHLEDNADSQKPGQNGELHRVVRETDPRTMIEAKRPPLFVGFWSCDVPGDEPSDDQAIYGPTVIEDTVSEGLELLQVSETLESTDGNYYPSAFHNFREQAQFPIILQRCGVESPTNILSEYPIREHTPFNVSRIAGQDRIVFDGCGIFCGLVTHKGLKNNRFHECKELGP